MLRGIKHRHVGPDFCKNADSSKSVMDAGDSQQQFNLRKIVLSNLQNKGFEFCLMSFQRIHVATNDFELLRLLISEDTVNCFLNLCNGCFTAPIYKGSHVKLLSGCSNNCVVMADALLPNTLLNTSSSLKLETVRQFWARFFSPVM